MTKAGILVGIVGGLIAIYVSIIAIPQYFERLNNRVSQLEEQMRSLTASSGATALSDDRLNRRVSQLEERVRSLADSSAATAAALTEANRKPAAVANPVLRKCAELAEAASTGEYHDRMGFVEGPQATKNALMSMEKLGCSSIAR